MTSDRLTIRRPAVLVSDSFRIYTVGMSRPFNTTQPLGKIMFAQRWTVADLAAVTGINSRTISDYLAGRRVISERHLTDLAAALSDAGGVDIDPADLIPDPVF